jgi:rhodanese-related sulfurtransferase
MKTILIISLFVLAGFFALFYFIPENTSGYKNIRAEEAMSLIKNNPSLGVLDVRTPAEYASGHIAGAQNIDWENPSSFSAEIAKLDKTKEYIVYCRSGNRSVQASKYLEAQGFTNVSNVLGGTLDGGLEVTKSDSQLKSSLDRALQDEYFAFNTYKKIIEKFGEVKPFSNVAQAEQKHINLLLSLYQKYDIEPPLNSGEYAPLSDSLKGNCRNGVEAEIQNVELYKKELLPAVSSYEDVVTTFTELMNASELNHLEAFKRCL